MSNSKFKGGDEVFFTVNDELMYGVVVNDSLVAYTSQMLFDGGNLVCRIRGYGDGGTHYRRESEVILYKAPDVDKLLEL